ncbi:MAG: transporter substrate-binding domain-containing protein [Bdellovibrionales bacterium]|nr:transporter substrate-binding domain-containing protein [Bdellovibrionales bacterium]
MNFLTILFLFQSLNASGNISTSIEVSISDVPPISYLKEGNLVGINIDILKQLEKKSNIEFNLTLYPHARLKKSLDSAQPDMLIVYRAVCEKYNETYEVKEIPNYVYPPYIYLLKTFQVKSHTARVARMIGTCSALRKEFIVKEENIIEVASMEQAFKMIEASRIDGICGNDPVFQYNLAQYKKLKNKFINYRKVGDSNDYHGVVCLKKTLPLSVKNKLEKAAKNLVVPNFHNFL